MEFRTTAPFEVDDDQAEQMSWELFQILLRQREENPKMSVHHLFGCSGVGTWRRLGKRSAPSTP